MFSVQHPMWLWMGLTLAAAIIAALVWQRRRSGRWLLAGLVLPGVSAVAIALALGELSLAAAARVEVLLDFTPSTTHSPWRDPAWVQALAQRHLGGSQRLSVIAFSGQERRVLLSDATPNGTWPAMWNWDPPAPPETTVLADAIALRAGDRAARWVITDGLFPAIPADPGIAWTFAPPGGGAPDAAIRDLQLRVSGGEAPGQVEVLVQVRAVGLSQTEAAQVVVRRDGQAIADQAVEFRAAPEGVVRWLSVTDRPPGDGPHHYTATVTLPRDVWPQNDHAAAVWPAGGGWLRTLIIGDTPAALAGSVVKTQAFDRSASQLAAEGWQVVVLNDVPAESSDAAHPALAPAAARALDAFVRQNGGGLVLLSGEEGGGHAFGPGRYGEGTAGGDILEALSPVASHPPLDDLAVMLLLDASSSMNDAAAGTVERKISVLARAVQEAARYLAPQDVLTVVTFNASAEVLAQGSAEQVAPKLPALLAGIQPGGTTNPDAALPELRQFTQRGTRRLVIFVTDGEIPTLNVPAWSQLLSTPGTRLTLVAPPAAKGGAGGPLVELAAIPGVTWSQTENPGAWAEALRASIVAQTRGTLQNTPLAWQAEGLRGTAATWTRTWTKPEATILGSATPATDAPVAASAQRGLGKVAALTISDDDSPAYRSLRDHLVQAVAAAPGDRRFTMTASRAADGRWLLVADGTEGGKFLDGQQLAVTALGSDAATDPIPMLQTAPGHYVARLPASADGLATVVERPVPDRQLVARVQAPAVETTEWPATVEPARIPAGVRVLGTETSELWQPKAGTPLSPWLWGLAAVAALAALWLRKS